MLPNRIEKLKKLKYLCANLPNGVICKTPYGKLKLLGVNVADGNNNAILNFGVDKDGFPIEFYVSEVEVNTN